MTKRAEAEDISVEQKLVALYSLQQIDSQIDKIKIIRGELPLEVQDLEDEIAGLATRVSNFKEEIESFKKEIGERLNASKTSEGLIAKYQEQQNNVRNNREYDSLTKEIEFQTLEIQLTEKKVKEFNFKIENLEADVEEANARLKERTADLEAKRAELTDIVAETEKEEQKLIEQSKKNEKLIEDRLLNAYKRIRENARNGLGVVQVERGACGGCFNKIPPQHQMDIKMHKKVIVCDYCGRILTDHDMAAPLETKKK